MSRLGRQRYYGVDSSGNGVVNDDSRNFEGNPVLMAPYAFDQEMSVIPTFSIVSLDEEELGR